MVRRRPIVARADGLAVPAVAGGDPVPHGRRRGEEGYNLVILIVAVTILNVMAAVALPLWSYTIRREREEETIFRGLQYAEAIRVFRQRFGRYPATLEELVKVEPRSIRQLWNEPLSEDGEFGLVVEAPPPSTQPGSTPASAPPGAQPAPQGQAVQPPPGEGAQNQFQGLGVGGGGQATPSLVKLPRVGPDGKKTITASSAPLAIHGVYLDAQGEALRKFFGQDKYEQWMFTAEQIRPPVTAPGRPLPRVRSDWIGKSFPDGLSPSLGTGTGPGGAGRGDESGASGKDLTGAQAPIGRPLGQSPTELVPQDDGSGFDRSSPGEAPDPDAGEADLGRSRR